MVIQIDCSKPLTVRCGAEKYQQTHKKAELKAIITSCFNSQTTTTHYCVITNVFLFSHPDWVEELDNTLRGAPSTAGNGAVAQCRNALSNPSIQLQFGNG